MLKKIKVAIIASECNPIAKIGGLADVVGSLPKYLEKVDVEPFVIMPRYGVVDKKKFPQKEIYKELKINFEKKEEKFKVFQTNLPKSNVKVFLIDHPILSKNGVYLSTSATVDGTKEVKRFTFFSAASLKLIKEMNNVDLIHLNDWHTSLIPYIIKNDQEFKDLKKIATVLTIHNMGHSYQGISDISVLKVLGTDYKSDATLAWNAKSKKVDYLEQGIKGVDLVNTVSPSYAQEITTEEFCEGLCHVVSKKGERVWGILNGIDYEVFNPAQDLALTKRYSFQNWQKAKIENKTKLQKLAHLTNESKKMLLGMVTRIDSQKGLDLVLKAVPKLMDKPLQFVILGTGNPKISHAFVNFSKIYEGKFAYFDIFDSKLASQIYAGADAFLMPSKFEPCGLGQMIASRYGTPPIVRNTGGLKDTIEDGINGFKFTDYTPQALIAVVDKALMYFKAEKQWQMIVETAMRKDFSWDKSAKEYVRLYKEALRLARR